MWSLGQRPTAGPSGSFCNASCEDTLTLCGITSEPEMLPRRKSRFPRGLLLILSLTLAGDGLVSAQQSVSHQPVLLPPWRGTKHIIQGNHGAISHNVCHQRSL